MKPKSALRTFLALAGSSLIAISYSHAETWVPTAAGTYNWNSAANWSPASFPNAIGATANLNINVAGAQIINLNVATTVGTLNFGDLSGNSGVMTLANGTSGSLIFDNGGSGAVLNHTTATTADVISATITLNDDLTITNAAANSRNAPLTLSGKISGASTHAITIASGTGFVFFSNTANDFSGGVILNAGSNFMTSNNSNAFGTGLITINGGSVTSAVPSGASQNLTTANDMTWNGNWTYIADTNTTAVWTMNGGITLGNNINVTRQQNMTINGIIDDGASTYSLTFSGGATNTTLTNANTYGGGTTIGAGSLTISGSGSLGAGNYAGAISNSGTFNYSSSADQIFSGAITGTGALIKNTSSSSTLTLSNGSNSYTGATTLSAGTLVVSSTGTLANTAIGVTNVGTTFKVTPAAGTVNLGNTATSAAGASLNLGSGTSFTMVDGTAGGTTNVRGGATGPTGLTLASANLNFELGGAAADKLAVTRAASLTGVNYLNLTPVAALTPGTYNLITASSGLNGGRFVLGSGGTKEVTSFGGVSYVLSLNNSATTQSVTVDTGVYWTGQTSGNGAADSSWNTTGSTNIANASTGASAITYANGNNVVFQDANAVAGGNVTNATVTIQAAGVTPGATIFNNSAVNYTLSNASGTIGLAGTGGLIKQGSGSLTLNSVNTFTGGVGISAGNLILGNTGALNSTAGSENAVTFGTGSTGTLSLAGNSVIIANLVTNSGTPGTPVVQNATGSSVANATLTVGNSTNAAGTFAGILQNGTGGGTLALIKVGTGTLTLSGNNTFSGGLTVNAGTLLMSGTQSYTGGITLAGGGFGENSANGAPVIQASTVNGNAITVSGSSHLILEGTLTSTIAINSGTLKIGASNSALIVQGVVSGSGVLDVNANGLNANYSVSLTNTANTFTGDVTYTASNGNNTLSVASIGDAGKVLVGSAVNGVTKTFALDSAATAPLTFNTRQFELTGLSGAHNLAIANNSAQAFNINTNLLINATAAGTRTLTLKGTGTGLGTFGGTIDEGTLTTLAITKVEAGTWALTGANTYNGKTTISTGTLSINSIQNASSTTGNSLGTPGVGANSIIDIANTGTLRYTGTGHSSDRVINMSTSNAGITIDASGPSGTFALTGGVTTVGTANSSIWNLTGSGSGSQSGAFVNGTGTNVGSVNKTGIGTWTLAGANSYTGTTSVSGGGTLVLDYTSQNNSKLSDTSALTVSHGGGDITLKGGSHLETVNGINIGATPSPTGGHTSITRDGGTAKLAFGAINRLQTAGSTLSFAEDSLATTSSAVVNGILGGGITVGSNWAKVSGGDIVALTSGDYTALPTTATTATVNYQLTGSQTHTGTTSLNSLRIVGDGNDQVLTISSGNLTPSSLSAPVGNTGGILYAGGGNNNYTITGAGGVQAQNGNQELIINTFTGTLTLDMAVTTGSAAAALTKTGAGTLILTKSGTYTGGTMVNQGTLKMGANNVILSGPVFIGNATLDAATFTDTVGTLDPTAAATINFGSGGALAFAASNAVSWSGATLNLTGTLNFAGGSGSSLRFGTTNAGLTAVQLSQITASGYSNFGLDADGYLTAVSGGSAPEIAVDQSGNINTGGSKSFGTVTIGSPTSLIFTINNTGNAALNLSGSPRVAVTGDADFTVTAQPAASVAGPGNTTFTVQFAPSASGVRNAVLSIANNDTTGSENPFIINVSGTGQTPYEAWALGGAFNADANGDGVKNGLAFLLGATSPTSAVIQPTVTQSGGDLILNFNMLKPANRGTTTLNVQHSRDLGIADPWATVLVPDATNAVPTLGVTFVVGVGGGTTNPVTATISSSEAGGTGKLFGRLQGNNP